MAKTKEPVIQAPRPERKLQNAVEAEINEILKHEHSLLDFFLAPRFGLDLAVFMKWANQYAVRFLEFKAFLGSRQGGVGFGNQQGDGTQVELLLLKPSQLAFSDKFCRWIFVDGTKPQGSARFVIFNNSIAFNAAMGGVHKGKQNNLRVKTLMTQAITWNQLSIAIESFLKE